MIDILLVDDEEAVRKEGAANLIAQLKENGVEAFVDAVGTLGDGLDHLEKRTFHVAVVDLRLKDATAGGNEVSPEFRDHGLIFVGGTKKMGEVGAKILEWHARRVLEFFFRERYRRQHAPRSTLGDDVAARFEVLGVPSTRREAT